MFALAPPHRFFLGHFVFHGLQPGALVRTIAKRWMTGTATRAPPVHACLDFERQRFRIADQRFFSHAFEAERIKRSTRGGNRQNRGFYFHRRQGFFLIGCQFNGGRILIELRIPLGRHFVQERRPEPSCENNRRTTDKFADVHQMIRECLLFPCARIDSFVAKKQSQIFHFQRGTFKRGLSSSAAAPSFSPTGILRRQTRN